MKSLLITLVIVLFFAFLSMGQQTITGEQILTINKFAGLNTRSGDFSIKPNQFRDLYNFDLDRNRGSLTVRLGYDSIGTMVGQDSILGIYGAYYADGSQQLFIVTDSAGVGYGNIYVTQPNSNLIDKDGTFAGDTLTRLATHWPIFNIPVFTMFEDKVFITNGSSKAFVYDRSAGYLWPPNKPGEPTIIPIAAINPDSILDGEFRYLFLFDTSNVAGVTHLPGLVSHPVRVKSGHIRLSNFQWMVADSTHLTVDSIIVYIYRTKANPGTITETDSAYWIGRFIIGTSQANLGDSVVIDSVVDANLSSHADSVLALEDFTYKGRISSGVVNVRYGAPTLISSGLANADTTAGVYSRIDDSANVLGFMYATTFLDTATLFESELGPTCDIIKRDPKDSTYLIGLPRIADNLSGIKINLYRAPLFVRGFDTSRFNDTVYILNQDSIYLILDFTVALVNDTIKGDFHLIGQFDATDTAFQDDIENDSAYYLPQYRPSAYRIPSSYLFSANDQLYSILDNTLSFTAIDSSAIWFPSDAIVINADDGDRIIAAYAARGVIRVFKSKSMYNIYQNANGVWNKQEVANYIGIVAPHSLSAGVNGVFYLTDNGVFREQEGIYKDRYFDVGLVSDDIIELDTLSVTIKSSAIGFQYKNLYILSLPSSGFVFPTGKTFVRFNRTGDWGTWSLTFGGATLYSTETSLSFIPGDTLYFFRAGQTGILRYGTANTDNGDSIRVIAISAPFLTRDMSVHKSISRIGIAARSSATDTILFTLRNEEGTGLLSDIKFGPVTQRYRIRGASENFARYFGYTLANNPTTDNWDNVIIDGIDIFWNIAGQTDDE